MNYKFFLVFSILFFSDLLYAQQTANTSSMSKSTWNLNVSTMNWNEPVKIQKTLASDYDIANFNGYALGLEKDFKKVLWGFSLAVYLGSGRANTGGNSTVLPYQQGNVGYTIYGFSPRVYYRLADQVSLGVTALIFSKNITWPQVTSTQTVTSGRKVNAMPLLDLKVQLTQSIELFQGIGPLAENSTLWRLGAQYNF